MPQHIVIVGAGHAGGRVALRLRNKGFDGDITLIGEESWHPYERPPLSKALLKGDSMVEDCMLMPAAVWPEQNIELHLATRVCSLEPDRKQVRTESGMSFQYDRLILATGGVCRKLAWNEQEFENIHVLRSIDHCLNIRKRLQPSAHLVIIGGGFIGLEVAASAVQSGCQVTVVEMAHRLLTRVFPQSISESIRAIHENHGVRFLFNDSVKEVIASEAESKTKHRVKEIILQSGTALPVDAMVVGIGIDPENRLAVDAGLEVDNGIVANEFCQTSNQHIYAIGDCVSAFNTRYQQHLRLESWKNAELQAEIVAAHLCGGSGGWNAIPWLWTDQYQYNIQMAGMHMMAEQLVTRGSLDEGAEIHFALDDDKISGALSIAEGLKAAKDLRIAQMLMEKHKAVHKESLSDTQTNLKHLLK